MILLTSVLSWTVVAAVLVGLFDLLRRRTKTVAEMVFAVFSGSLAMAVLQPELAESPDWVLMGLVVGGCATCNGYWLFARALFRGDEGVRWPQVAVAVGIASLILLNRATAAPAGSPWHTAVGALLTLTSSTVLVLAFVEAVRGWAEHRDAAERRMRIVFMAVYGACVLSATLIGALAATDAVWPPERRLVVVLCALSILALAMGTEAAAPTGFNQRATGTSLRRDIGRRRCHECARHRFRRQSHAGIRRRCSGPGRTPIRGCRHRSRDDRGQALPQSRTAHRRSGRTRPQHRAQGQSRHLGRARRAQRQPADQPPPHRLRLRPARGLRVPHPDHRHRPHQRLRLPRPLQPRFQSHDGLHAVGVSRVKTA
jgi:hypothetical protein